MAAGNSSGNEHWNFDYESSREQFRCEVFHERAHLTSMNPGISPAAMEFVPANYFASIDLTEVFGRQAPLEVDLGCGDGSFLVAMAKNFPDRNYLGIERMFGRVRSASARACREGISNMRVLRVEISYAVKYLLPPESTSAAYLLFPDPWPKKRHQRRRIVTEEFISTVHQLLVPDGLFHIATDQADYFAAIRALVTSLKFAEESTERNEGPSLTTFEKRFLATGAQIYRLTLRKTV